MARYSIHLERGRPGQQAAVPRENYDIALIGGKRELRQSIGARRPDASAKWKRLALGVQSQPSGRIATS